MTYLLIWVVGTLLILLTPFFSRKLYEVSNDSDVLDDYLLIAIVWPLLAAVLFWSVILYFLLIEKLTDKFKILLHKRWDK